MPAHRSDAETEIRDAVIAKLRLSRPGARTMHEINALEGRNRIDVLSVDRFEIIAIEIKSERDKLDRLPDQLNTMAQVAHRSIVAVHRKFMPEITGYSCPRIEGAAHDVEHWWHPGASDMAEAHHDAFIWRLPERALGEVLPSGALRFLWAAELKDLCGRLRIGVGPRAPRRDMIAALRWQATGEEITRGVCRALRQRRECAEADPPIEGDAA